MVSFDQPFMGRYQLREQVGSGRMSTVDIAQDLFREKELVAADGLIMTRSSASSLNTCPRRSMLFSQGAEKRANRSCESRITGCNALKLLAR